MQLVVVASSLASLLYIASSTRIVPRLGRTGMDADREKWRRAEQDTSPPRAPILEHLSRSVLSAIPSWSSTKKKSRSSRSRPTTSRAEMASGLSSEEALPLGSSPQTLGSHRTRRMVKKQVEKKIGEGIDQVQSETEDAEKVLPMEVQEASQWQRAYAVRRTSKLLGTHRSCSKYTEGKRAWKEAHVHITSADTILSQMAGLAGAIYHFNEGLAGWHLKKYWDVIDLVFDKASDALRKRAKHDDCEYTGNVGIYKRGKQCALVFAGTDDFHAVRADLNFQREEWCGIKGVHAGFVLRVSLFFQGVRYKEFEKYLERSCGGRASFVGHSLGGALATLAATCMSKNKTFSVDSVYTFGAPGIASEELVDHSKAAPASKCFKGARVYNVDETFVDPVPVASAVMSFKHPKLRSIKFSAAAPLNKEDMSLRNLKVSTSLCDTEMSASEPYSREFLTKSPRIMMHTTSNYINRSLALQKQCRRIGIT